MICIYLKLKEVTRVMNLSSSEIFKIGFQNNETVHQVTMQELKKIQKILFEMLCVIDQICAENNIKYCLCGGSAIGALRHNGFIPWDDDLDIFMLRNDIFKFAHIVNEKYGDLYEVRTPGLDDFFESPSTTMLRKDTIFRSYGELGEKNPGVCCDICILENVPTNKVFRYIHGIGSLARGLMTSCRRFSRDKETLIRHSGSNDLLKKTILEKAKIGSILSLFSYEHYVKKQWKWNSKCKNYQSEKVVCPNGRAHYFGEIYDRKIITEATLHEFCGRMFYIPANADEYLTGLYGDYMKIPDRKERESKVIFELKL